VHFVSRVTAVAEINSLLHQSVQSLERSRTRFDIMALFCGGQPRDRLAVPGDEDVMAFFGFSKQSRELLLCFPNSETTHFTAPKSYHYIISSCQAQALQVSPMTSNNDVILRREGALGHITLNRPSALNALTHEMCASMLNQLQDWARDAAILVVVIDAVPGRAFCAGGDIRAIYDLGKRHDGSAQAFFATEYRLNAAIKHFPKPYVALIDAIAMGGGVGVSVHGTHRVIGEDAIFAMPETAIGLYPDVGGSYFLPRLPGELGMYLALTGMRIGAADMLYAGIATHFVPAAQFAGIAPALARGESVDAILSRLAQDSGPAPLAGIRDAVDRAFAASSVQAILQALGREGEWGRETAALLGARSPTSLKLTFRAMREGKALDFDACMRMEYRITTRALEGHDLYEGVRAAVIDKDQKPRWQPASLEKVPEAAIAAYFAPLGERELPL
jgi:enoyl-CoA hydratase